MFPNKPYGPEAAERVRRGKNGALRRSIRPAQLRPYLKAVRYVLSLERRRRDYDTLCLLVEMKSFLDTLPNPRRQRDISSIGLGTKARAVAILGHIYRQQNARKAQYTTHASKQGAAFNILERAMAMYVCIVKTVPNYEGQFLRSQVARSVYSLLRSDIMELYGKRTRHRISCQGKHLKNRLYDLIEPKFRWYLTEERVEKILGQRWLQKGENHVEKAQY